jgi:hypothetical protein
MQTYIFVENGTTQIVLTPETDFEKHIVEDFDFSKSIINTFKGNFADCQGGWTRLYNNKDSIIIKCDYNQK